MIFQVSHNFDIFYEIEPKIVYNLQNVLIILRNIQEDVYHLVIVIDKK